MFSTELKIFMRVVPLYLAVSAIEFGNPVVKRVQQFRNLTVPVSLRKRHASSDDYAPLHTILKDGRELR